MDTGIENDSEKEDNIHSEGMESGSWNHSEKDHHNLGNFLEAVTVQWSVSSKAELSISRNSIGGLWTERINVLYNWRC